MGCSLNPAVAYISGGLHVLGQGAHLLERKKRWCQKLINVTRGTSKVLILEFQHWLNLSESSLHSQPAARVLDNPATAAQEYGPKAVTPELFLPLRSQYSLETHLQPLSLYGSKSKNIEKPSLKCWGRRHCVFVLSQRGSSRREETTCAEPLHGQPLPKR